MSRPRQVLPGRCYLITRSCTQKMFLLRPDKETNNAFLYCLMVAAKRHNIRLLFTLAMSNHHHTGVYDPDGNYPKFIEFFHQQFAKCQNTLRGRWENFWASRQTSVVRLVDDEDVVRKLVYTFCNPVEAKLVAHALDWPGASSLRATLEQSSMKAVRPSYYFRENGPMPEQIELEFAQPPGFEHLSRSQWSALVAQRVEERERVLRQERAQRRESVLGVRRVLRQRWSSRPPVRGRKRGINPRVAARDKWRRMEALRENRVFLAAYRAAWERLRAGVERVIFPQGTYWLAQFAGVSSEPVPLHPGP